jgi:hypothetical protein
MIAAVATSVTSAAGSHNQPLECGGAHTGPDKSPGPRRFLGEEFVFIRLHLSCFWSCARANALSSCAHSVAFQSQSNFAARVMLVLVPFAARTFWAPPPQSFNQCATTSWMNLADRRRQRVSELLPATHASARCGCISRTPKECGHSTAG